MAARKILMPTVPAWLQVCTFTRSQSVSCRSGRQFRATLPEISSLLSGSSAVHDFLAVRCRHAAAVWSTGHGQNASWSGFALKTTQRVISDAVPRLMSSLSSSSSAAAAASEDMLVEFDEPLSSSSQGEGAANRDKKHQTGGFKNMFYIPPTEEMLAAAKKAANKVSMDLNLRSPKERSRRRASQAIHEYGKALSKPLGAIIDQYPNLWKRLHPFERSVMDLAIADQQRNGIKSLDELIKDAKELRKLTTACANDGSHKAMQAQTQEEAGDVLKITTTNICEIWETKADVLDHLRMFARGLRGTPVLDLSMASVVLVGCPNVGKSSIVRLISSGQPEVANYPFTTRKMSMGHMKHHAFGTICQVMDTPGVLARDAAHHNLMELLTLACIQHTNAVVIFVLDPSGTAGPKSSTKSQLYVREYLRGKFPDARWIDVISKSDLPRNEEFESPADAIAVSCHTGDGKEVITKRILECIDFKY